MAKKARPRVAIQQIKTPTFTARLGAVLMRPGAFVIYGLSVAASVLAFLPLWPNITVSPGVPLDKDRMFSTPFTVMNIGLMDLRNVRYGVAIGDVRLANGQLFRAYDPKDETASVPLDVRSPRFFDSRDKDQILEPNKPDTMSIDVFPMFRTMKSPVVAAEIGIIMEYRVWYLPYDFTRTQRFLGRTLPNGERQWFPKSLEENSN